MILFCVYRLLLGSPLLQVIFFCVYRLLLGSPLFALAALIVCLSDQVQCELVVTMSSAVDLSAWIYGQLPSGTRERERERERERRERERERERRERERERGES